MRHLLSFLLLAAATVVARAEASPVATPGPAEVGSIRPFELRPDLAGAVATAAGWRWSRVHREPNAAFLKLRFADVHLRSGDQLLVRSRTGRVVEEITGRGPKGLGTFWGLSAFGDEIRLELRFRHEYEQPPFRVDQILVGDLDPFSDQRISSVCSPDDFEDVICYQGDAGKWANVRASVGVMTVGNFPGNPGSGNGLWCSGSNISEDNYILTNDHCIGSQGECDNAEFVFKYYRTGCGNGSPPNEDWVSYRCDEVLVNSPLVNCEAGPTSLDFTVASVVGNPAATYGWANPDPTPLTSGEPIYIVQHPDGRPHEITHGSGADVVVDGLNLRYYDTLDTESGSSGSPIFRDSDDRLVGLHHCGGCEAPGIGNRGMLMSDIYPLIESLLHGVFADGFESGDTQSWNLTLP